MGGLLDDIGSEVALGMALALGGTWAGWLIGRCRPFPLVRWIRWWVVKVVRPLVSCRSWVQRTAFIFLNNIAILAALVAIGAWLGAAIAGAALLGLSLGIALRVIGEASWDFAMPTAMDNGQRQRGFRIGVALNLLEPFAIALALGISISRGTTSLSSGDAWRLFAYWVTPLMLVAAMGEALWLGAGSASRSKNPRS
jgi:disulfide bond formation protein DsbB